MRQRYDLVVIGCGPAGEKAAAQAAYFGKRVAVIERAPRPGGAAVHTGTLPSKTLRETALYLSGFRNRRLYGLTIELDDPHAAVPHLIQRKEEIAQAETTRMLANLDRHGVDLIEGHARFIDDNTVEVEAGGAHFHIDGSYFVIATGSHPYRPASVEFDAEEIYDSDEILDLERLPSSMIVIGGGVIGCEYACMFAALGVDVTIVDARAEIIPYLDREVLACLRSSMEEALGIRFLLSARWEQIDKRGSLDVACRLEDGRELEAETLLYAAGRSGNSSDLGLDALGIEPNRRGHIPVNEKYQTSHAHIFAVGDVIGFPALASTSMEQGRVAVCHAFGFDYKQAVSSMLPYGIYTIPEVSSVGETEESCREKGLDFVVGRALLAENARGQITGDQDGMIKLIIESTSRRIIGAHVVGERGSELVHIGQALMQLGGTVDDIIDMTFNFPTLSEAYKYAAYDALGHLAHRT